MTKFEVQTNEYFEEEKRVLKGGEEVLRGDYYHDNINQVIKGFFKGLDYAKFEYEVEHTVAPFGNPDDYL